MSYRCITAVVLFFLAGTLCHAQKSTDLLITTKGDTLRGKVKIMSFDIDQAQVNVDGKKKVFPATQVVVLKMNGEFYRPIRRLGIYRFMLLIRNGYLSLYGFRDGTQNAFDSRFLVKRDGKSLDLPNLTFRRNMIDFLDDCPEVSAKLENGTFGRKDLDAIIDAYNACIQVATQLRYEQSKLYVSPEDPKILTLETLRTKVKGLPEFENQKNALDLISDIQEKIKKHQALPKYQVEGLKEFLGNNESVKTELASFLASTKQN